MSTNAAIFFKNSRKGTFIHWDGDGVDHFLSKAIENKGIDYVVEKIKDNNFQGFSCIHHEAHEDLDGVKESLKPRDFEYVIDGLGIGYKDRDASPMTRKEAKESIWIEYIWNLDPVTGEITKIKGD